jgi:hypothetical protein
VPSLFQAEKWPFTLKFVSQNVKQEKTWTFHEKRSLPGTNIPFFEILSFSFFQGCILDQKALHYGIIPIPSRKNR